MFDLSPVGHSESRSIEASAKGSGLIGHRLLVISARIFRHLEKNHLSKVFGIIDKLGKHHLYSCRRHLGIAQIAFAPPAPHSTGHSGALHLRKQCPTPFREGSRPPKIKQILPKNVAPDHSGKG